MISQHVDATSRKTRLSAAQPKPKDRGEIKAFVPDLALRRAALKRANSSSVG